MATQHPQSLADRLLDQCTASRWHQSARQASHALWGHCGEGVLSSSLPPAKPEGSAADAACLTGLYHLYLARHLAPPAPDANHRCSSSCRSCTSATVFLLLLLLLLYCHCCSMLLWQHTAGHHWVGPYCPVDSWRGHDGYNVYDGFGLSCRSCSSSSVCRSVDHEDESPCCCLSSRHSITTGKSKADQPEL